MAQHDWLTGGDRHDAAVDRIFRVATELVAEHGFAALGPDTVAARAGCSRATLYRYVGGKRALRDGVIERAARAVLAEVRRATAAASGHERAVTAILAAVTAVRADPVAVLAVGSARPTGLDSYFATSQLLENAAAELTGAGDDRLAAAWVVRIVLSLLVWPGPDAATEAELVRRFVGPAFGSSPTGRAASARSG